MMRKRGVSPLIATVLLIAFAVALGAIVMNWGRTYVEDTQEFAREGSEGDLVCSSPENIGFEIRKVSFVEGSDPYEMEILVKSTQDVEISSFIVQVENNATDHGLAVSLPKKYSGVETNGYKKIIFDDDDENGNFTIFEADDEDDENSTHILNITKVILVPRVEFGDEEIGCAERSEEMEYTDFEIET